MFYPQGALDKKILELLGKVWCGTLLSPNSFGHDGMKEENKTSHLPFIQSAEDTV
jgi:hypothetical protein